MDNNRQNKRRQYTERREKKDVEKMRFTLRQFTIRLEKYLKIETRKGKRYFMTRSICSCSHPLLVKHNSQNSSCQKKTLPSSLLIDF